MPALQRDAARPEDVDSIGPIAEANLWASEAHRHLLALSSFLL
jgi:hypothetical protein